jgi:predicted metallo-beta-lactamase superfamily hydrolase
MLGFLESPKQVKSSIDNLNNVVEQREKMIDNIIFSQHNVTTDKQYDTLFNRYSKKSYIQLVKKFNSIQL